MLLYMTKISVKVVLSKKCWQLELKRLIANKVRMEMETFKFPPFDFSVYFLQLSKTIFTFHIFHHYSHTALLSHSPVQLYAMQ